VDDELQPFSVFDAGLEPELLADAVQSRGTSQSGTLKHATLSDARLRFLFLAARIWRHAGRVGVSSAIITPNRESLRRLMERLRMIASEGPRFAPVLATALTG
jgi:hypothetical protein